MSKAQSDFNKQLISLSPDALIDMYEIDFSNLQSTFQDLEDLYGINLGADAVYRFCPMINGTNPIIWRNYSYQPLPIKAEGFESKSDGRFARPKLTIANPDGLLSKILHSNNDFANSKVTRKRTYVRFLDKENFPNQVNPFGENISDAGFEDDLYFVNRKVEENKNVVQFELVSALELEDAFVPARVVMSNYCSWSYRCEIGCNYSGLPIETSEGKSLIKGFATQVKEKDSSSQYIVGEVDPNKYWRADTLRPKIPDWNKYGNIFIETDPINGYGEWRKGSKESVYGYKLGDVVQIVPQNSNNLYKSTPQVFVCTKDHSDPSKHYPFFDSDHWAKDECAKTMSACIKRFSDPSLNKFNNTRNKKETINFGGFPGTERFQVE